MYIHFNFYSALTTKFKRGRFLKRQQCQESAEDAETGITKSEPPPSPPSITVNTAPSLVKQISQPLLPSQSYSSPSPHQSPPPEEPPCSPGGGVSPHPTTSRQPSLDPLCGLESVPLLYSSSGPGPRLPPSHLLRPTLPSVRVIPETEPMHELLPVPPAIPSPSLLYPGVAVSYEQAFPPAKMPMHKPRPTDSLLPRHFEPAAAGGLVSRPEVVPRHPPADNVPPARHSDSLMTTARPPATMEQFGHCPKVN